MKSLILSFNSLLHFLVDTVCLATIYYIGKDYIFLVPLYNTLAFSTQCIVGIFTDKLHGLKNVIFISCILVVLGAVLPISEVFKICLIGIGNSVFHVSAGTVALVNSDGKAKGLGFFVAPGALGVFIGTNFSSFLYLFSILLFIISLIYFLIGLRHTVFFTIEQNLSKKNEKFELAVVIVIVLAVMVRAIGGAVVSYSWNNNLMSAFVVVFSIFLGKFFGGYVSDKLGVKLTSCISIPTAAVCIIFCSGFVLPSLIGQFMLNISMPITLWLLYKSMEDAPGTAFGLAASALWPGVIVGQYVSTLNASKLIFEIIAFIFALISILYSERKVLKIYEKDN